MSPSCKSCAQGEIGTIEPEFRMMTPHIRHTIPEVATPEYPSCAFGWETLSPVNDK